MLVLNPAAGRGRAAREWPALERRLRAAGLSFEVAITARAGDATEFAEGAAPRHDAVVAAGGDGTVHEVVNGLMRAGAQSALGVIPLGSGDDFAKLLPGDLVARLLSGDERRFDVGRIDSGAGTRYFANGMDVGFGAHGADNLRRVPGALKGLGAYLGALVLTLLDYPVLRLRVQLDDAPAFDLDTVMAAAMNGTTFGGSFRVCPEARPDDGLLDLLLVDAVGRVGILDIVAKILRGTHAADPRLRLARARRLRIESPSPLIVEADGEIAFREAKQLDIAVLPRALRLIS